MAVLGVVLTLILVALLSQVGGVSGVSCSRVFYLAGGPGVFCPALSLRALAILVCQATTERASAASPSTVAAKTAQRQFLVRPAKRDLL